MQRMYGYRYAIKYDGLICLVIRRSDDRVLANLQGEEAVELVEQVDAAPDQRHVDLLLDSYDYLTRQEEIERDAVEPPDYDHEYDAYWADLEAERSSFYDDRPDDYNDYEDHDPAEYDHFLANEQMSNPF